MQHPRRYCWHCGSIFFAAIVIALGVSVPMLHAQQFGLNSDGIEENTYPNAQYYVGLELYREGSCGDASGAFDAALKICRRDPSGRWIDAIPVHAMLGECFYQAGDLPAATQQIDAALEIAIRYGGWLGRVDWNLVMKAGELARDPASAWAGNDAPSIIPYASAFALTTGSDFSRGISEGPLAAPRMTLVDGNEILRGLAIALYRRRIIFGPLSSDYEITSKVVASLGDPGNVNASPLVGSVTACGHFGSGHDNDVLMSTQKSSVIAGRVHPLSPIAMIAAARVLASRDNFVDALPIALRAAAAAAALRQPELVHEAMLVAGGCVTPETAAMVKALATAAASAHLRSGRSASIGAMFASAEASTVLGDLDAAQMMVNQAATLLQRREVLLPRTVASFELIAARLAADRGAAMGSHPKEIDEPISRMLAFALGQGVALDGKRRLDRGNADSLATPRLFQLGLIIAQAGSRGIGNRAVDLRLAQYVTDLPSGLLPPQVWRADHVDALAFESYDLSPAIAAYLVSTWKRQTPLEVLVQSDALLRRRYLATLPLGGRVHQTRRLAATERDLLVDSAAAIFVNPPPRLARMTKILATPLPLAGSREWSDRGATLESLATQLALSRGNLPPSMPPPLIGQSDIDLLARDTAMITFVQLADTYIGTVTYDGTVKTWSTIAARAINAEIAKLLRGIGVLEGRGVARIDDAQAWRSDAAKLASQLLPEEVVSVFSAAKRLVVVPDGPLWYLPFELLESDSPGSTESLADNRWGDRYSITYSPTPGFVLHPVSSDRPNRPTGIVSYPFFAPRDAEMNATHLDTVTRPIALKQSLPGNPPLPTSQLGESIGRLLVLGVVEPNMEDLLSTTPGLYDAAQPSGRLASWMRFPSLVPVNVFLPGYRTAATSPALGDGRELSVVLTTMHCCGVRNVLLSRWPVGGESTAILMREFLQELPHDDPDTAWSRAVALLRKSQLVPAAEPLLRGDDTSRDDLSGDEPLFWAGYLLDAPLP